MSADPPFIVPSTHPFKVEATPSKMGGVDALAKRPLDMSGKADPVEEHREPVPEDAPPTDTWVSLPDGATQGLGGEGPVLQEQIDTSHREYFDDPSRYLRTDVKVRLPGADAPRDDGTASPAAHGTALPGDAPPHSVAGPDTSRPRRARTAVSRERAARPTESSTAPPRTIGDPRQRRDAFNERLASIMSRQQRINEELSAVEQAVQSTRTALKQDPSDDTPHNS